MAEHHLTRRSPIAEVRRTRRTISELSTSNRARDQHRRGGRFEGHGVRPAHPAWPRNQLAAACSSRCARARAEPNVEVVGATTRRGVGPNSADGVDDPLGIEQGSKGRSANPISSPMWCSDIDAQITSTGVEGRRRRRAARRRKGLAIRAARAVVFLGTLRGSGKHCGEPSTATTCALGEQAWPGSQVPTPGTAADIEDPARTGGAFGGAQRG